MVLSKSKIKFVFFLTPRDFISLSAFPCQKYVKTFSRKIVFNKIIIIEKNQNKLIKNNSKVLKLQESTVIQMVDNNTLFLQFSKTSLEVKFWLIKFATPKFDTI